MKMELSVYATVLNDMKKQDYKPLPMDEIHPEAKKIAIAWIENYKPYSSPMPEIAQKIKLASDIMNFAKAYHEEKLLNDKV